MRITPLKIAFFLLFIAVVLWVVGYANGGSSCPVVYKTETVSGGSLAGYIESGSKVRVAFGYYACAAVAREDLVIYDDAGNENGVIKMAKAVAGDSFVLALAEGGAKIVVNGEVLKTSTGEPYRLSEDAFRLLALYERDYQGVIPNRAVLLLGNLAGGSRDSTRFGLVDTGNIVGKVVKVY